MNNTGKRVIKNKNDNIQLILCHDNVSFEYTSSVAPRHTQIITSQAHKTQNQCLPHKIWIECFLQWVLNKAQTFK